LGFHQAHDQKALSENIMIPDGLYENQEPDWQPEFNLRGRFRADAQGRFHFQTVKPKGYTLPSDGPVGQLVSALGLGLERPAHIHFRVSADGFETLTTHVFDRSDAAIDRDAIFGVKPELLADFRALPPQGGKRRHALDLSLVLCPRRHGEIKISGRR
jgi:protocatechuate 3,4-dioxygenase beta subunit